jgi:hypothetical protein
VIAAEEAKPEPDPTVISALRDEQAECARWREQLDPGDRAEVAEARHRFSRLADEVRARRDD